MENQSPFVPMTYTRITKALIPDPKECSICIENYRHGDILYKIMNCAHYFHKSCVEKWNIRSNSCPLCRCDIDVDRKIGEEKRDEQSLIAINTGYEVFSSSYPNYSDLEEEGTSDMDLDFPILNNYYMECMERDVSDSDEESEIDYPDESDKVGHPKTEYSNEFDEWGFIPNKKLLHQSRFLVQ